jgi:hypothetical protein
MLEEVARTRMAESFQTTLTAASLKPAGETVGVEVVRCGDSAFLAFAPDGHLLVSSPAVGTNAVDGDGKANGSSGDRGKFAFGPGDELMAKVVCSAADRAALMQAAGISMLHESQWVVCMALDRCGRNQEPQAGASADAGVFHLGPEDRLLVPKYLAGSPEGVHRRGYVMFPFSRLIRVVGSAPISSAAPLFGGQGSVTAVLPDHFYAGKWTHFQERFPADTNFVLATDGFYRAFTEPGTLWTWLATNRGRLDDPADRALLLKELHAILHARRGDDDISFVWVYPGTSPDAAANSGPRPASGEGENRVG